MCCMFGYIIAHKYEKSKFLGLVQTLLCNAKKRPYGRFFDYKRSYAFLSSTYASVMRCSFGSKSVIWNV